MSGSAARKPSGPPSTMRSEEHTSELQSPYDLVCRLLLEKKNNKHYWGFPRSRTQEEINLVRASRWCLRTYTAASGQRRAARTRLCFLLFGDPAPPRIFPLSLHDALPI